LTLSIRRGASDTWQIDGQEFTLDKTRPLRNLRFANAELSFTRDESFVEINGTYTCATYDYRASVSSDGGVMSFVQTLLPFAGDRPDAHCPVRSFYGSRHVFEYKKQ
jgi:hypothetical protein